MLTISGDRGSGKTAALIGAFLADPCGVLVFPNRAMVEYASRMRPEVRSSHRVFSVAELEYSINGLSPAPRLYLDEPRMYDLPEYCRRLVVATAG